MNGAGVLSSAMGSSPNLPVNVSVTILNFRQAPVYIYIMCEQTMKMQNLV